MIPGRVVGEGWPPAPRLGSGARAATLIQGGRWCVLGCMTMWRLFADEGGKARFEVWGPELVPEVPGAGELSASAPLEALAAMVVRGPAGGGHPEQPEAGRRLVVVLAGECEVTVSGETVVGRPGDVLLVEDTTGSGHSSRSATGFEALVIVLD
ncbi:cupin domain-containing protein [Kribbella sp. NPDC051718]|uniref:cupin domain-containing protein n=1 Tax=Kribbella sp. NPDC051718 TaxID=3155168 RepID=UPI003431EC0D